MKHIKLKLNKHESSNRVISQDVLLNGTKTAFKVLCRTKSNSRHEIVCNGEILHSYKSNTGLGFKPAVKFLASVI